LSPAAAEGLSASIVNRAALVRGIQGIVAITLLTFAWITWRGIAHQQADLVAGLGTVRPLWLVLATVLALQEGVCGGLRMYVLGRVLCPTLTPRTAIASEFVLMFVGGVTPGQLGAPVAQVATLVEGGMPLADIATAELLTAFCTIFFFLVSAAALLVLRTQGLLVLPGAAQLDYLVGFSVLVFGASFVMLVLSVVHPPLLKGVFRLGSRIVGPVWHGLRGLLGRIQRVAPVVQHDRLKPGVVSAQLIAAVDRVHLGFMIYLRRGKGALGLAFLLTVGFFWARFTAAFLILKGLGLPTTPESFVTVGPPVVQVIVVQTMLNFALYLSPTPGASGIAETLSTRLMSPWVRGVYEIPYLVLWRFIALFLCMMVGGTYVFRYLGTDVLERRAKEAREADDKAAAAVTTSPEL